MPRPTLIPLVLLPLAACRPPGGSNGRSADGSLAVDWTGSAAGHFSAPAEARWCPGDTLLEVIAVRNDTAVGFSLMPRSSIEPGEYPIQSVSHASPDRPQAGVAVRWFAENEILPFEAAGGTIRVTADGSGRLSGTLRGELRRQLARDSLHLVGSFSRLAVRRAASECGRAARPGG